MDGILQKIYDLGPVKLGLAAVLVIVVGALIWSVRRAIAIILLLAGIVLAFLWLLSLQRG